MSETALQPFADYAEEKRLKVERGVAVCPLRYRPHLVRAGQQRLLGEFDACPALQKASPVKEPFEAGAAGHGCGHNLFGAASLGAAIAIKELIQAGSLKGTIRFYGTPAEESVGGKLYMARAGKFSDLDVCLAWHPEDRTQADTQSTQAMVDFVVEFKAKQPRSI